MQVNIKALLSLADEKGWSTPELARRLGINYSYLYRIIRGSKNGGLKVIYCLYKMCSQEGLNFNEFIILPATLSDDNKQQ